MFGNRTNSLKLSESRFFEDMVRVGRALKQVYAAIKINYSILEATSCRMCMPIFSRVLMATRTQVDR